MISHDNQEVLSSCSCESPCTGSVSCPGGCGCLSDVLKEPSKPDKCLSCSCTCQGFSLTEIASKGDPLDLKRDSIVRLQTKNLSMETLVRFLSYHAPSLEIYMPAKAIEEVIDYQTPEPETFQGILAKLGLLMAESITAN
jgi:hypothetical protein